MLLAFCISESNLHVTQVILKPALKGTCWYPILWQSACEIQLTTLFCGLIQHLATQLESSMKDETIKWPGRQMVWPKVRRLVRPMAWIVRPIFRSMAWILGPIVRPMAWILGINSSLTYEDHLICKRTHLYAAQCPLIFNLYRSVPTRLNDENQCYMHLWYSFMKKYAMSGQPLDWLCWGEIPCIQSVTSHILDPLLT